MNTNTNYKESNETYLQNKAWERGQEWIETSNKWEKMEYLKETCSNEFFQECTLLDEMVRWMDDQEFNQFFKKICSHWNILTPPELDYEMNN